MGEFLEGVQINRAHGSNKLSMRHGPIDLIVEAYGESEQTEKAYQQAAFAFESVLTDLVSELDLLRTPLGPIAPVLQGQVSTRMVSAAQPFTKHSFVTPMIAVAGSVADHILKSMTFDTKLDRAYVNNGGDIAIYLKEGATFDIGICANIETGRVLSKAHIHAKDNVRGIATSGWRGRSHSLGIADAVTVLAKNAATADAAATLISNSIDLPDHQDIVRQAACELAPDSDLGDQLVTVDVGVLSSNDVELALRKGKKNALLMIEHGLIDAAHASLQGKSFSVRHTQNKLKCHPLVSSRISEKEVRCA